MSFRGVKRDLSFTRATYIAQASLSTGRHLLHINLRYLQYLWEYIPRLPTEAFWKLYILYFIWLSICPKYSREFYSLNIFFRSATRQSPLMFLIFKNLTIMCEQILQVLIWRDTVILQINRSYVTTYNHSNVKNINSAFPVSTSAIL